jgi:hypothetical protein
MKKLILSALASIAIVISSCNQNSPAPSPATPTPTPTPTPTSSMTATEALLVGDWIWDKNEEYTSGIMTSSATPTSYWNNISGTSTITVIGGSHIVLKSSFYNNTATTSTLAPQNYNADYYVGTTATSGYWNVNPGANGDLVMLLVNQLTPSGYIITLNASTLVVQSWVTGQIPNGTKSYYHK